MKKRQEHGEITQTESVRRNNQRAPGRFSMRIWPIAMALVMLLSTAGTALLTNIAPSLLQKATTGSVAETPSQEINLADSEPDTYNVISRGNLSLITAATTPAAGKKPSETTEMAVAETRSAETAEAAVAVTRPIKVLEEVVDHTFDVTNILPNRVGSHMTCPPDVSPDEIDASSAGPENPTAETIPAPTAPSESEPTVDANGVVLEKLDPDDFTAMNKKMYVRVNLARIRKEPISTSAAVASVTYGDVVTCKGVGSDWSQVHLADGQTGYVLSNFLTASVIVKPTPTPTVAPTAAQTVTPTPTVAPTPTPIPTATPAPEPTVDANGVILEQLAPEDFAAANEKMYVKVNLARVREEPISTVDAVATVVYGDVVTRTGIGSAWSRIRLENGQTGYILSTFITNQTIVKPTPEPTAAPTTAPAPTEPPEPTETAEPTVTPEPTEAAEPTDAPDAGGLTATQEAEMIALAKSALGVKYVFGGSSMDGFDCSGFTRYIYKTLHGIYLPHSARDQSRYSGIGLEKPFSLSAMRVGDIICFDWTRDGVCDHVGLYIGGGQYIHASSSAGMVVESTLNLSRNPIVAIRRIIY